VTFGDDCIIIGLSGPLRLVLPGGREVRVRSRKGQGCLALLATGTGLRRSRAWLADKLWSDRGPEQAAGSLRQTLVELRRALGPHGAVLAADRQSVWLDPARVAVERDGTGEFLEGIDVQDPEWEEWLRVERAADRVPRAVVRPAAGPDKVWSGRAETRMADARPGSAAPIPAPVSVAVLLDDRGEAVQSYVGGVIAERLARLVAENLGVAVRLDDSQHATVRMHVVPRRGPQSVALSVSLRASDGVVLWSGTRMVAFGTEAGLDRPEVLALMFEAQDALAVHLSDLRSARAAPACSAIAVQRAASDLISFEAGRMHAAERELEAQAADAPSPIVLAWLMMTYRTMILERIEEATPERIERIEAAAARAIELGSTHPFSLAAASAMFIRFLGRPGEGVDLARRAVRLNPANPFAVDALGSAYYLRGQAEEGYRMANLARSLAAGTRMSPYFDMGAGVAATLTGRHDEAIRHARTATAVAPHFRVGWRYRIAHAAHRGDADEVNHCVRRLALVEPDFTAARMLADPGYPTAAIRNADLDLTLLRSAD
jgi:hypothetical protein